MKTFLALLKINLNTNFGISSFKYKFTKEKKKRWEPILIGIALIVGFGPLLVLYTLLMQGIFAAGLSLKQPEIVLTISFLAAQFLILIFGIFYIMGAFYFSKDLNILIPLPLKPYQVLGSKFAIVIINEYLTALPILLPPIIIFGVGTNQDILYWIKAILLILASPVIPLIIAALFIIVLMRVVNVKRNKDLLTIVGGFFGFFVVLGVNVFTQRMANSYGQDFLKNILIQQSGLIEMIGRSFPPTIWATLGLSQHGMEGSGYFLLFIAASMLLIFVLLWLGNQVFYKSVLSGQEVSRKKKVLTDNEITRSYEKASNPVMAIFKREWKILLRTPIYAINGLTGSIIGPFIVIIMFFAKGQGGDNDVNNLFALIQNPGIILPVTLGGLGLVFFVAGMNLVASTSVSREGQTFWISKMIPVSAGQQVYAKFLNGYSISILGAVITVLVLAIFFKFAIMRVIVLLILGIAGSVPLVALNLLIDVLHPKLVWNSPQEAMKQNMNGILGMLVAVVFIAVLGLAAVLLILVSTPEWLVYAVLFILIAILSVPSMIGLFALADKRYRDIEI